MSNPYFEWGAWYFNDENGKRSKPYFEEQDAMGEDVSKSSKEYIILILNIMNVILAFPLIKLLEYPYNVLWLMFILGMAGITLSVEFVILERR